VLGQVTKIHFWEYQKFTVQVFFVGEDEVEWI